MDGREQTPAVTGEVNAAGTDEVKASARLRDGEGRPTYFSNSSGAGGIDRLCFDDS